MFHVDQQNQSVAMIKGFTLSPERAPLLKRKLTHSLNIEKLGGWQHGAFTSTFCCLCNIKVLLIHKTLKEKPGNQHRYKTLDLQLVLPTKYSRAMGTTNLWE